MELETSGTDVVSPNANRCQGDRGWVFPALLVVVLLLVAWFAYRGHRSGTKATTGDGAVAAWTPAPEGETAGLLINYGNGVKKQFTALSWHEGMSVADLMRQARRFPPGLAFTQQGKGASGLLTSIDGLGTWATQGYGWRYQVNGRHSEVSFCIELLQSGDIVLWTFGPDQ